MDDGVDNKESLTKLLIAKRRLTNATTREKVGATQESRWRKREREPPNHGLVVVVASGR